MPLQECIRQPKLAAKRANLILEQLAKRLDQLQLHALRQAADIVMRLDGDGWPAVKRDALDDVGVERALRQKFRAADLMRRFVENLDEQAPDRLALLLGIGDAFKSRQEAFVGLHMDQRNVVGAAEQAFDFLRFALAQQAVIDENTGERVADRLMEQDRGDSGIHAARKSANHLRAPTCSRTRAISASRNVAIVQELSQPAILCTKFRNMIAPLGVWTTSG